MYSPPAAPKGRRYDLRTKLRNSGSLRSKPQRDGFSAKERRGGVKNSGTQSVIS
jgi:hypothetical protein